MRVIEFLVHSFIHSLISSRSCCLPLLACPPCSVVVELWVPGRRFPFTQGIKVSPSGHLRVPYETYKRRVLKGRQVHQSSWFRYQSKARRSIYNFNWNIDPNLPSFSQRENRSSGLVLKKSHPPLFHAKFGDVPLVIDCRSRGSRLIICVITFETIRSIYTTWYLNITDRRTDERVQNENISIILHTICMALYKLNAIYVQKLLRMFMNKLWQQRKHKNTEEKENKTQH